jgi:hypothetical protein
MSVTKNDIAAELYSLAIGFESFDIAFKRFSQMLSELDDPLKDDLDSMFLGTDGLIHHVVRIRCTLKTKPMKTMIEIGELVTSEEF